VLAGLCNKLLRLGRVVLLLLLVMPGRRENMGWGGGSLPRRATVANLARSPTGMMERFQVRLEV
jgi:hypothetical protein